jgi:hypothetical protein
MSLSSAMIFQEDSIALSNMNKNQQYRRADEPGENEAESVTPRQLVGT